MSDKKVQEGLHLLKQADKLTQKTLTRWKADWEGAALLYEQAANTFKNGRAFEQAKQAFEKASHANEQSKLLHSAAKLLEQAAAMAKEQRLPGETATLLERAAAMHRENGSPTEAAADCFVRAAKAVEEEDDGRAAGLAAAACELFELDDRPQFAVAPFKLAVAMQLKRRQLEAAVDLEQRLCAVLRRLGQTHELHKQALSLVILLLHSGDVVAASRRYQQFAADEAEFGGSSEGRLAAELLDAVERGQAEQLQLLSQRQTLTFLDNQIARLAKTLRVNDLADTDGGDGGGGLG